jgi:hypothetical protein
LVFVVIEGLYLEDFDFLKSLSNSNEHKVCYRQFIQLEEGEFEDGDEESGFVNMEMNVCTFGIIALRDVGIPDLNCRVILQNCFVCFWVRPRKYKKILGD